ncbi:type II toxin-antitoxin system HicA family toxin [Thermus caldifontis]|uniref:type II toxin-antitoxin system HicA family toxin n=1 Tax=Thermus caldifontis TaxID=1930763 RepID=UPI000DF43E49|nr:type II toxin-antitoxin system HicA family toxin [Thermus caldifontis]
MSPRLTPIAGKELVRLLQREGFQVVRMRGTHVRLKHPDGRATTVPVHEGELLRPGTLLGILRDVGWSKEEYERKRLRSR